jgi:hypothetical protein
MMARGSAVAVSESNYDANAKDSGADNERFRSASEVGSIKDDEPPADDLGPIRSNDASAGRARSNGAIDVCGDDTASASVISSLTMTTDDTVSASVVSSLTMPTLSAPSKRSGSFVSVSSEVSLRSALDRTRRAISRARGPPPALQEDESGSGFSSAGCDSSSLDRYVSKVLLQYVQGQGQPEHEQGQPQPTTTTSGSESLESIRLELAALVADAGPPAPAVTSGVLKCDATSDATKK